MRHAELAGPFTLAIASAVACSLLNGCSRLESTEDRINSAIPISASVNDARARLKADPTGFHEWLGMRLRERAAGCRGDYSPSLLDSDDDIRKRLATSGSCFKEADDTLAHSIDLLRVGQLLAAPPLRPIPDTEPTSLSAPGDRIQFAENAGIALLQGGSYLRVLDLHSGQLLWSKELRDIHPTARALSSNGQLFIDAGPPQRIREVETGEVIAQFGADWAYPFRWLDSRFGLLVNDSGPRVVDFVAGREMPFQTDINFKAQLLPVGGEPGHFVLRSTRLVKVALTGDSGTPFKVLAEAPMDSSRGWVPSWNGAMADGRAYVEGSYGNVYVTNLATLQVQEHSLAPLHVISATPTPDPDLVIVTGVFWPPYLRQMPPDDGNLSRRYVLSLSDQTLALLDPDKLGQPAYSGQFLFVSSLNKIGVMDHLGGLALLDSLPTLNPRPISALSDEAAQFAGP